MPPAFKALPFGGGVNLFEDPRLLSDGEWQLLQNLFPYTPGSLSKRKAMRQASFYAGVALLDPNFIVPPFIDIFGVISGSQPEWSAVGETSTVVLLTEDGATSTTWGENSADPRTPAVNHRLFMFAYQNKVYVLGGHPWTVPALVAEIADDPLTPAEEDVPVIAPMTFGGTGNEALVPRVAGVYRDRIVWGDLGPGFEDYLLFSDPFQPTVIGDDVTDAASGRAFSIGARSGDKLIALVEITQGGIDNPSQSALLVLRQHSAYIITGEPNFTTDVISDRQDIFASMVVNRINVDTGCVSAETVVRTEHGVFWASLTDVWMMPPAGVPYTVGTKIRPALQRCPPLDAQNWHAAYFDGVYRLAIHGEGQGPAAYVPETMRVEPVKDQWWLDLRAGAPKNWKEAAWYGPQIYDPFLAWTGGEDPDFAASSMPGTFPMSPDLRPGRTPKLLAASPVTGASTLQSIGVVELEVAGSDRDDATEFPGYATPEPNTVTWGHILGKLRTKTIVSDGMADIRFMACELRVRLSLPTGFQLDVNMDDGRKVASIPKGIIPEGFLTDVTELDTVNLQDSFQAKSLYPPRAMVGKDLFLTIQDLAGYVVPEGGLEFWFTLDSVPTMGTLLGGVYPDFDMLAGVMNQALIAATGDETWVPSATAAADFTPPEGWHDPMTEDYPLWAGLWQPATWYYDEQQVESNGNIYEATGVPSGGMSSADPDAGPSGTGTYEDDGGFTPIEWVWVQSLTETVFGFTGATPWAPIMSAETGDLSDAQKAESSLVWGMLGWDTTGDLYEGFGQSTGQAATFTAPNKRAGSVEIGAINVKTDTFGRRP